MTLFSYQACLILGSIVTNCRLFAKLSLKALVSTASVLGSQNPPPLTTYRQTDTKYAQDAATLFFRLERSKSLRNRLFCITTSCLCSGVRPEVLRSHSTGTIRAVVGLKSVAVIRNCD